MPLINQPLVPDAIAPGGVGFTLTVNGTGFVSTSVVNWNGSPRAMIVVSSSRLTAAILASDIATVSTASVTVVNPGPGGGTSSALFFPIASPRAFVSFGQTDLSSLPGPVSVVTADFDRDGNLDLALADWNHGLVEIFLGNGDGTFRAGQTYSSCYAYGLALGDFNGDGIMDLVTSSAGCGEVTMLLGNGDGTFREGGTFSTTDTVAYSVAVGDFNFDGKLDLVTANPDANTISILLGNGDGTFQNHVDYPAGPDARYVATGDLNGDGRLDIAVTLDTGVAILFGNGDGTFQPETTFPLATGYNPNLLLADLNGDGKLDLAVANTAGSVTVLLGKGDGSFNSGVPYSTGGYSAAVAAADCYGDGVLDLITTDYYTSNISVLHGNGDGTFGPNVNYPADLGALGIAVADFNGDGRLDVAVANQYVDAISIFLQTPSVGTAPTTTILASSVNPSTPGQLVTFTAKVRSASGTPTGTVIFYDGSTALGSATLGSGNASLSTSSLSGGTHSITATYQGSSSFAPSTSAVLNQVVSGTVTRTSLASSPNPPAVGQRVTFTARVRSPSGTPTGGAVIFYDGSTALGTAPLVSGVAQLSTTSLSLGVQFITAAYQGSGSFGPSKSAPLRQVVKLFTSKTVLVTSGSPSFVGKPVTFTATVTSTHGPIPNGEVVTFYDGSTIMGTGTTSSGVATFTTSSLTAKAHTVKAAFAGDSTFQKSSAIVIQVVDKYATTTALSSSPNPAIYGQPITYTATVTSTGPHYSHGECEDH